MFDSARDRISRAKQFAIRHHTLVACAATGVITWKVTKNTTLKAVLKETTGLSYNWGLMAGQLEMLLDESYNFIKDQGLESEFVEFANMQPVA